MIKTRKVTNFLGILGSIMQSLVVLGMSLGEWVIVMNFDLQHQLEKKQEIMLFRTTV
nr:hypothetical protein [Polaribacter litorisediminis]